MSYKFERLEVWQLAMEYSDMIYALAEKLPRSEDFNLKSPITRAVTSVSLNIAEGSTSQTDPEQARFVGLAIRSLIETVACQHHIHRRKYLADPTELREAYLFSRKLFAKLQALRSSLKSEHQIRDNAEEYRTDPDIPF
ncbi:MAG: four helix bundle protein [Chloroflexi bacterium]|nr:four helix bundle protein [Chloroflexota bacterium]